jgi:predicted dehydrogenase
MVGRLDPNIRLTTSEREFAAWRELYDVVFIGSPPFLHLRQLELAATLNLPIICEKPLTARREELPRLKELLGRGGPPFMLAHHVRHQLAVEEIVGLIRDGGLGPPIAADLRWCFPMDHGARNAQWKLDPALSGSNAMFDCGVHAVDLAMMLFGAPARVAAVGHWVRCTEFCDSVTAVLDYPEFAVTIVASQSAAVFGNDLRIAFEGSVLQAQHLLAEQAVRVVEITDATGVERLTYEPVDLYRSTVEDFCRSLDGSSAGRGTSAAEALLASRILFAVEDSLRSGAIVELSGYFPA